jgi:hypothetical protein
VPDRQAIVEVSVTTSRSTSSTRSRAATRANSLSVTLELIDEQLVLPSEPRTGRPIAPASRCPAKYPAAAARKRCSVPLPTHRSTDAVAAAIRSARNRIVACSAMSPNHDGSGRYRHASPTRYDYPYQTPRASQRRPEAQECRREHSLRCPALLCGQERQGGGSCSLVKFSDPTLWSLSLC